MEQKFKQLQQDFDQVMIVMVDRVDKSEIHEKTLDFEHREAELRSQVECQTREISNLKQLNVDLSSKVQQNQAILAENNTLKSQLSDANLKYTELESKNDTLQHSIKGFENQTLELQKLMSLKEETICDLETKLNNQLENLEEALKWKELYQRSEIQLSTLHATIEYVPYFYNRIRRL
jgi:predicted  nucleic acid-binding Zn-ribbon protein